jgi:hypothetical protein
LLVGDDEFFGVGPLVEAGVDLQAGACGGRGDQVDDHLVADQGLAAPVLRDEREQAVLDLVPVAGARREVTDLDREPGVVGKALQLGLPQAKAVSVRAAAVGGDRQRGALRVALLTKMLPPVLDRGGRELGGVAVDADVDPALVAGEIEDPVGDRVSQLLVREVVRAHLDRAALGRQLAADGLEIPDQLPLVGVDRDRRLASVERRLDGLADVAKLGVRSGWEAPSRVLALACRL